MTLEEKKTAVRIRANQLERLAKLAKSTKDPLKYYRIWFMGVNVLVEVKKIQAIPTRPHDFEPGGVINDGQEWIPPWASYKDVFKP